MTVAYSQTGWAAASPGRAAATEALSDEVLIRRIANGDQLAMRTLFGRHRLPIYRWLLRLVDDEALADDLKIEHVGFAHDALSSSCSSGNAFEVTLRGLSERELLAAAQWACQREVWDRCINTSERTRTAIDFEQRFPMPHKEAVIARSKTINLDPAYVYGLIRQESRFVTDARSHVGASGLMQVMPATAKWTARKIGLTGFTPDQISDRDTNIAIGTGYLKLVLDSFEGSMPLAAGAYNAGPSRSRRWRAPNDGSGPILEGAIWAENVPFHETRDYVKKVLSNTTNYAALITGQPQSLKAKLGLVGPRDASAPAENLELP